MKKRVFSGMRPTGKLHLGHLVGALGNWVRLQDSYDCFYMVADWHAFMSEYEKPQDMSENSIEMVRDFLAAGIDPKKCVIFVQSQVSEHLELAMMFGCMTPLGWVERCPTYKEQLREITGRDLTTYGFLGYPILQAADIALYKASAVPVGVDQLPHLELTREIIRRFNGIYKKEVFPEPEPLLTKLAKLLGLDNRKMSKSYSNFIALSDSPEEITKKVSQMITDPERQRLADKGHPDICGVFSYFATFGDDRIKNEARTWCEGALIGCTECKKRLAGILVDNLDPIRQRREKLSDAVIKDILADGAKRAREVASKTMDEVKKLASFAA